MKILDLFEARRNPDQNPRESTFLQLRQLAGKYGSEDLYVRYVNIPKLGHNIGCNDDTPLGIYAYPMNYVLSVHGHVPYGHDRVYVIVFKLKSSDRIWDLHNSDIEVVKPRIINTLYRFYGKEEVDQHIRQSILPSNASLWYLMYSVIKRNIQSHHKKTSRSATEQSKIARKILQSAGFDGAVDLESGGIIHTNEPSQAVFFDIKNLQLLDIIRTTYYLEAHTDNSTGREELRRTRQRKNKNFIDWKNRVQRAIDELRVDPAIEQSALHFIQELYQQQERATLQLWCKKLVNYLIATDKTYFKSLYDCLSYSPAASYKYCTDVLNNQRCEPLESTIAQSPVSALNYAKEIIKGRWPEGEHIIYKSQVARDAYEEFLKIKKQERIKEKKNFRERLGKVNI